MASTRPICFAVALEVEGLVQARRTRPAGAPASCRLGWPSGQGRLTRRIIRRLPVGALGASRRRCLRQRSRLEVARLARVLRDRRAGWQCASIGRCPPRAGPGCPRARPRCSARMVRPIAGHARQSELLDDRIELALAVVQGGGHAVVAVDDPVVVAELDQLNRRQRPRADRARRGCAASASANRPERRDLERQEVAAALRRRPRRPCP